MLARNTVCILLIIMHYNSCDVALYNINKYKRQLYIKGKFIEESQCIIKFNEEYYIIISTNNTNNDMYTCPRTYVYDDDTSVIAYSWDTIYISQQLHQGRHPCEGQAPSWLIMGTSC